MLRLFKKVSNYLGYFQKNNLFFSKNLGGLGHQVALPLHARQMLCHSNVIYFPICKCMGLTYLKQVN